MELFPFIYYAFTKGNLLANNNCFTLNSHGKIKYQEIALQKIITNYDKCGHVYYHTKCSYAPKKKTY